jgi:hypothetical protein
MIIKLNVVIGYNDLIGVDGDIEAATASPEVRTWSKASIARCRVFLPGDRKWIF